MGLHTSGYKNQKHCKDYGILSNNEDSIDDDWVIRISYNDLNAFEKHRQLNDYLSIRSFKASRRFLKTLCIISPNNVRHYKDNFKHFENNFRRFFKQYPDGVIEFV